MILYTILIPKSKTRNPFFQAMVERKKGAHKNRKKARNKMACRGRVNHSE